MGDTGGEMSFIDTKDNQLTLAIIELGVAVLLFVNIFWHLCARNWNLLQLIFNLLTVVLEITTAIFAIVIFIGSGADASNSSACAIIAFIACGFCFIRLIIGCIQVFSKKKSLSKYENYSKWNMFWPAMEVMISTLSLLLTLAIGYILQPGAAIDSDGIVEPEIITPE